jgi:hypothetical protein
MPRTAIAIQAIARNNGAQLVSAGADQANGNIFPNDGKTVLVVKNGDASPRTCTIVSVACSHGRTQDLAVVVANGEEAVIGPFDAEAFNQKSGADIGQVYVNWSAGTAATVKVTARQQS